LGCNEPLESPHRARSDARTDGGGKLKPTRDVTDPKVIKALTHPLRHRILGVLDGRVASPSELAEEFESPIGNVSYHVRMLESVGLIRLVRTTPKRGAIEHHYEAVARPIISDETWGRLPTSVKRALVNAGLDHAGEMVSHAAAGNGFERSEAQLSHTQLALDDEAWKELSDALNDTRRQAFEIGKESEARLKQAGENGVSAMLLLLAFERASEPATPRPARRTKRRRRRSTSPA
jgi:DNA-binding transcriptional ArsR family regulator